MTKQKLIQIIKEELEQYLLERCQKGYKTHPTRKKKKMYGKTYRNCVKADERKLTDAEYKKKTEIAKAIERDNPDMPDSKKYAIATATAKKVAEEGSDPKKGTGKKPKGSGRRLYTDENPKDTVSIKFATPTDARKTVAKVKNIKKPYARKIQILTVGEQRAKVMGKTEVVRIFKKAKESLKKAHEKTKRMNKNK